MFALLSNQINAIIYSAKDALKFILKNFHYVQLAKKNLQNMRIFFAIKVVI